jgi:hypothetical protein
MLPGSIKPFSKKELRIEKIEDGLYVVRGAYEGQYDFFEASPLFAPDEEDETSSEISEANESSGSSKKEK